MKKYSYKYNIQKAFGNLYRKATVVIVVKNSKDEYLLGSKPNFYPEGITRLLGGGIKEDETPILAAKREMEEELGVNVEEQNLEQIAEINVQAIDQNRNTFNTMINIIEVKKIIDEYIAGDDVKFIEKLDNTKFELLINKYTLLTKDMWYRGEEGEFCWEDFGKVYSIVHKIALELTK